MSSSGFKIVYENYKYNATKDKNTNLSWKRVILILLDDRKREVSLVTKNHYECSDADTKGTRSSNINNVKLAKLALPPQTFWLESNL